MRYLTLLIIASCTPIPTSVELSLIKTTGDKSTTVNIRTYNCLGIKELNGNENNKFALPGSTSAGIVGTIVIYANDADVELRIDAQGFDESLAAPISQGVARVRVKSGSQAKTTIVLDRNILTDQDHDGVPDDIDDCPNTFNPNQEDLNGDGMGDACSTPPSDASMTPESDGPPDTRTDEPPKNSVDAQPNTEKDASPNLDLDTQTDAPLDGTSHTDANATETSSVPSTGGTVSTGGASGTGGTINTGGSSGTGGNIGAGGASGTSKTIDTDGGIVSTGGKPGMGGIVSTGGTPETGGTTGIAYGIIGQSCARALTCSTISCCAQTSMPSSSFTMGTDTDSSRNPNESPPHLTTLDPYLMDKFEVTVGRFRSFYQAYDGTSPSAGSGAHPGHADSGWQAEFTANMPTSKNGLQSQVNCNPNQYQTWTNNAGTHENMPMNCISWYVAFAFCIWDGGRLPTEAEWEMAASNGGQAEFTWGSSNPDPATDAVMNCLGDDIAGCNPTDILPVGSRPAGANNWGNEDLAGNMWEFAVDYYDDAYYQSVGTCNNCVNLVNSGLRVIRGGDFSSPMNLIRATERSSYQPETTSPYVGFRCVH